MKIELEEKELIYLSNMLAAVIVSIKEYKQERKNIEKLRDKILPPRSYAKITRTDLENLKRFVSSAIHTCEGMMPTREKEEDKKHLESVSTLLRGIQGKLEAA